MIRTVVSSFLFIVPIYVSHINNHTPHLMMFTMAMGISIANHSHTFHSNQLRRELFCRIDCFYMVTMAIYIFAKTLYTGNIDRRLFLPFVFMNCLIFAQLGNKYIELYTENQRNWHVLFHIIGIISLTISLYA